MEERIDIFLTLHSASLTWIQVVFAIAFVSKHALCSVPVIWGTTFTWLLNAEMIHVLLTASVQ